MELFNLDKENSDIDNVWVDVIPVMATFIVRLATTTGKDHVLEVGLLAPNFMEASSPANELISWSCVIGEWDEERELSVEIKGEYCFVSVDDYMVQCKHQTYEESIVVDVFKDDEIFEELGYVEYDDFGTDDSEDEVA